MTGAARVQQVAGWIVVAIGFDHLGVTFVDYDTLSVEALWFAGTGFAILLIEAINVITSILREPQFTDLRGIRGLALIANACGATLGVVFVILTAARQPQGPLLVALFVTALLRNCGEPEVNVCELAIADPLDLFEHDDTRTCTRFAAPLAPRRRKSHLNHHEIRGQLNRDEHGPETERIRNPASPA
jgi:hypothetical protein